MINGTRLYLILVINMYIHIYTDMYYLILITQMALTLHINISSYRITLQNIQNYDMLTLTERSNTPEIITHLL